MALFGVMLFFMGVRLYNNGLLNCGYEGVLSYGTFDTEQYANVPLLIDGPHRLDIESGDMDTANGIINKLSGKLLWSENVDGITVLYAYSPRLIEPVCVHGQKVNLMIAVTEAGLAAGTPLLYGSY